jgi:hypothetical protein
VVAVSDDSPAEDGRSWVFRCPSCGWEIEVTVDVDGRASDNHRPTLRCLRTTDHVGDPVVEMEVVES